MPTPKSVVKFSRESKGSSKVNVTVTNNVDKTQYQIYELTRAALRDSCKYVKKAFQTSFNIKFKRRSGDGSNAPQYRVFSGPRTTKPAGYIGLPKGPGNYVKGFYAFFQERGGKTPAYRLLFEAAANNITDIRTIQAQYLDIMNDSDAAIEAAINEGEYGSENE